MPRVAQTTALQPLHNHRKRAPSSADCRIDILILRCYRQMPHDAHALYASSDRQLGRDLLITPSVPLFRRFQPVLNVADDAPAITPVKARV